MNEMTHHLVLDIGNSRIKLAVFRKDKIVRHMIFDRLRVKDIQAVKKTYPFEWVIFSSVRASNPYVIQHLSKNYHLIELNSNTKTPLKNLYKTKNTLGMDRWASVIGAHSRFPNKNVLVIDMGTCVKYDFVDARGNYHGGNIAPGLQMRLESMHVMTGKLPLVSKKYNSDFLGKSTKQALQNGAVWGLKLEIEGFIKTLTEKWPDITIILSGGDSKYFGEIVESKIFVLPELVLIGLNETLKYYRQNNQRLNERHN